MAEYELRDRNVQGKWTSLHSDDRYEIKYCVQQVPSNTRTKHVNLIYLPHVLTALYEFGLQLCTTYVYVDNLTDSSWPPTL
jgi:hypothetical protein